MPDVPPSRYRSVTDASPPQRAIQQGEELGVAAFRRGLVVRERVGHRVAVRGAGVDLGAVAHPGGVERPLELGDLLGRHAPVVVGKAEVDLRGEAPRAAVGAVVIVGDEAADVEAAQGRDALGVGGGDPPADPPAHAVAGDRDRAGVDLLEPVEIGAAVADDLLGRQAAYQRHDPSEHGRC